MVDIPEDAIRAATDILTYNKQINEHNVKAALEAALPYLVPGLNKEIKLLRDLFRKDGEDHARTIKDLTERHELRINKYADRIDELRKQIKELEDKTKQSDTIESEPTDEEVRLAILCNQYRDMIAKLEANKEIIWQRMSTLPNQGKVLLARYTPTSWSYHVVSVTLSATDTVRQRQIHIRYARAWAPLPKEPPEDFECIFD